MNTPPSFPIKTTRCSWAEKDPLYVRYHDEEWGAPVWDDRKLFEFLILEGAQAGLSWLTILKRREGYREAFEGFNPELVARFSRQKEEALMQNEGIIRNRLKIKAAVQNARAFLQLQEKFGSFSRYQWQFVGNAPLQNRWKRLDQVPASTAISDQFSKELKKLGFSFVGSTILYAHMQAVGMVNDHLLSCFRHSQVAALSGKGAG